MVVVITEEEFDTVVLGIAMLCAVMTESNDEARKLEASEMIMKGLALLKAGIFQ
jgi:hypothetical protein